MLAKSIAQRSAYVGLLSLTLSACFHPPYNAFRKDPPPIKRAAVGMGVGIVTGSLIGGTVGSAAIGALAGGTAGTVNELYHASMPAIIKELQKNDIEFIQYGNTNVLIVPTDHYFQFNSSKLNDLCYEGLNNIIKLLRFFPCSTLYVAAFTDNVGSREHQKNLSQGQAETMLTFLWAHNLSAQRLKAEGYGAQFPVGDNHLIHGSAFNRRIEIQWIDKPSPPKAQEPINDGMK
jgi:outer membrane protein OmpA-like peptidoglycan-associated protein